MMVTCPSCGQENPEGFRLCGMCGASLAPAPLAEAEERKLVSVLFVDLVGFTAASETADPEDVRARLRPYHTLLKREVERFGGTVEKFVGDAVMAVFGAPVAHEDDAERAVRSGLRILEAVEDLNRQQPGLDLIVRGGVATGEALVTLGARPEAGEAFVAGDVVNTASRLQGAAPAGSLVVDDPTARATRAAIQYEELEPVELKGKAEAVRICRALRARSRFGVDVEAGAAAPFVGRVEDLDLLERTFARAVRERTVQLVTIVGEPGVGKSRLVSEFRRVLDDSPALTFWRQGRCLPYGDGITFWALGEIVKAQAGILESDSTEIAADKLRATVTDLDDVGDPDWLLGKLAPLVGLGGTAGERDESFTAWRRFFEAIASRYPLVVFVEDLHWADGALVEFLEHLVDWATDARLLVVCTGRPELYERYPAWGGGKRNSSTISLSPLSGAETARLVSALLEQTVLPAETQAALLDRAGGNPLYAEEFVRMLDDRGLLERRGGSVQLAADEIPVPETLQSVIAARLDTLAQGRKTVLHDASVVGKVFWPGAVAAVGAAGEVHDALRDLVRKELVRPARSSSVAGEDEFVFWHAVVRDVAYGQIPRAARARKHLAAAEWLERVAGERVSDVAELVAEHYREALTLARATGSPEDDLPERTARSLVLAGDRAVGLDPERAVTYYREALELLPEGSHERPEALCKLAETLGLTRGDIRDALPLAEDALASAEAIGDDQSTVRALLLLSRTYHLAGEPESRRRTLVERAETVVERLPEGPLHVAVWSRRAGDAMFAGRSEESLAWAEKVLAAGDVATDDELISALQMRGLARHELGQPGDVEDLERAIEEARERGHARQVAVGSVNYGDVLWVTNGPRQALANHRSAREYALERGLGAEGWLRAETTWFLYDLGEWDEVLRESSETLAGRDRGQIAAIAAGPRALVAAQRGDLAEAEAVIAKHLSSAREAADPQALVPALSAEAVLHLRGGRRDAAVTCVLEIDERTRELTDFTRAWTLPEDVRILVAAGRLDDAEARQAGIRGTIARHRNSVLSAKATLAEARGDLEDAEALYGEAVERWTAFEHALETGHALFGRGRCLTVLGRSPEAELAKARALFEGLRARPLIAEVDAWAAGETAAQAR